MNKKVLSITAASLLAIGSGTAWAASGGTGSQSNQEAAAQPEDITIDKAVQIARDQYNGKVIEVEREWERGEKVYEVKLYDETRGEIEVDVAIDNGEIVQVETDDHDDDDDMRDDDTHQHVQNNKEATDQPDAKGDTKNKADQSRADEEDDQANEASARASKDKISRAKAERIALNKVDGKVVEVELDRDDGVTVYEITVKTPDHHDYDVEINAANGNVLDIDQEDDD